MPLSPDEKKIHKLLNDFSDVIVDDLRDTGFFEAEEFKDVEISSTFWRGITKASIEKNSETWPYVARAFSTPALDEGIRRTAAEMGTSPLSWHSLTTKQYFEERGLQYIKDMTITDRIKLKGYLTSRFGDNEKAFAKFVAKDSYLCDGNLARLRMIKRTETHTAVEGGAFKYAYNTGAQWKQWWTAGDKRVRETHRELHGNVRPIDQPFDNGRMICDEVNCRCHLAYFYDRPAGGTEGPGVSPAKYAELLRLQEEFKSGRMRMEGSFTIPIRITDEDLRRAGIPLPGRPRIAVPPKVPKGAVSTAAAETLVKKGFRPAKDVREARKRLRDLVLKGKIDPGWQTPARFKDGKPIIRFRKFTKDGANIGKVKNFDSLTLNNIVLKKLEEFELRCKNLGIPPLRGVVSPQSVQFAGQAGDGLMGLATKVQEDRIAMTSVKTSLAAYEDMIKKYQDHIAKLTKEIADIPKIYGEAAAERGYAGPDVKSRIIEQATAERKARILESQEVLKRHTAKASYLKKLLSGEPVDWYAMNPGKKPQVSSEIFSKGEHKVISDLEHEFAHHIHEQLDMDPNDYLAYKTAARTSGLEPIIEKEYYRQTGPNFIKDAYPTLYSTKNHREWFAENYSLYMMGRSDKVSSLAKPIIENLIERQGQGVLELE